MSIIFTTGTRIIHIDKDIQCNMYIGGKCQTNIFYKTRMFKYIQYNMDMTMSIIRLTLSA